LIPISPSTFPTRFFAIEGTTVIIAHIHPGARLDPGQEPREDKPMMVFARFLRVRIQALTADT